MDKKEKSLYSELVELVKKQNKLDTALQVLQVKYEKEMADEDNDKREFQLDKIADILKNIEESLKGKFTVSDDKGIKPGSISMPSFKQSSELSTRLSELSEENKTLGESLKEAVGGIKSGAALLGKGISATVSGVKNIIEKPKETLLKAGSSILSTTKEAFKKPGAGLLDIVRAEAGYTPAKERFAKEFVRQEKGKGNTASERDLLKQGKEKYTKIVEKEKELKAVEESIKKSKKQGFEPLPQDIAKKESIIKEIKETRSTIASEAPARLKDTEKLKRDNINAEGDNIESPQEIIADASKQDLKLTEDANKLLEEQLLELKKISSALSTTALSESIESKPKPATEAATVESGLGLGDALSGMGGMAKKAGGAILKGAKAVGRGALFLGKGVAKFAGSGAGKLLGGAAAVGLGAYTAYEGYNAAEDSKQAKLEEVQAKVDSGELTPEEAAKARKEIGNTATVEKSGAVGKGTGMAAGAVAGGAAGAQLGAAIGSIVPGVGTAIGAGVGTLAGGALGAFAGTKLGEKAGEKVGEGINWVKEKASGIGQGISEGIDTVKEKASGIGQGISDWWSGKKAEISDAYTKGISEDIGVTQAEQKVSSNQEFKTQNGKSELKSGTSAEKSILGSTTLGALFTKEGKDVDQFMGSSSIATQDKDGVSDVKRSDILGKRIASGSLFSKDTYEVTDKLGNKKNVSKSDYYKMQELAQKGDVAGAEEILSKADNPEEGFFDKLGTKLISQPSLEPAPAPSATGMQVANASTENTDLTRDVNKPVVNTQPIVSSSVNNINTQSFVPIKPTPRADRTGSALDRYNDRIAAF